MTAFEKVKMTTECLTRQIALGGRLGAAALRSLLARVFGRLDRYRFVCRAEDCIDETCPQYEDQFLCVHMAGRIPTEKDLVDTDVCIELLDMTDGAGQVEQVLSISPQWRRDNSPVFYGRIHNGIIPRKNDVLVNEVTIARIPLHVLRFARRGRRRLQVSITVVTRQEGRPLVRACDSIEYVSCAEGFIEIQQRREETLKACVELACAAVAGQTVPPQFAAFVNRWIEDKTQRFVPRTDLGEPLGRLNAAGKAIDPEAACERLLALGQRADRLMALDIALQAAALCPTLSGTQEEFLWALADRLDFSDKRFLMLCQKRLLTEPCPMERWRLLLGIRRELSSEELRQRLNGEYRKWNARVTHPDAHIRRQADIFLSLLAEVRSRQQNFAFSSQ